MRSPSRPATVDDVDDAAGPRRHHHHPVGEEDRLGDRVGDEHDGGAGLAADPDQLVLHPLAGHLVERAERLVHQQQPRPLGQRPGDRDALLHAAGELVGVALGEVAEARPASSSSVDPRLARGAVDAVQLERQLDVGGDRAPRQQPGLLEGDAVVLVEPGLPRRSCRRPSMVPAVGRVEVGDQAQQRALAAAARPDQRDELARGDARGRRRASATTSSRRLRKTRSTPAHATARSATVLAIGIAGSLIGSTSAQSVAAQQQAEQADGAGGDQADSDGAEDRRPGLAGSPPADWRVLDDHPADAAAQADRHLGDDGADHGAGGGRAAARAAGTARSPAAAAVSRVRHQPTP